MLHICARSLSEALLKLNPRKIVLELAKVGVICSVSPGRGADALITSANFQALNWRAPRALLLFTSVLYPSQASGSAFTGRHRAYD